MEDLKLIYIHYAGIDWSGTRKYEFLFSNDLTNVDGEDWDAVPASGNPQPPHRAHIHGVGRLETKLKLDLLQDSSVFVYWDGVDGLVALALENLDEYDEYPKKRLGFMYGENIKTVNDRLLAKDLILIFDEH